MKPKHISEQIDVEVPLRVAYNQWTQFEDFPHFMEGVEKVTQIDAKTTRWHAKIGGRETEWTAEIHLQEPDNQILWKSVEGAENIGRIEFEPITPDRTRVRIAIQYEPEGAMEEVGSVFGVPEYRIRRDLENFKEFIESRGRESGAWRGRIGPQGQMHNEPAGMSTRRTATRGAGTGTGKTPPPARRPY